VVVVLAIVKAFVFGHSKLSKPPSLFVATLLVIVQELNVAEAEQPALLGAYKNPPDVVAVFAFTVVEVNVVEIYP
jgi:hypothetical protein